MPARSVYLAPEVVKWLEKNAKKEERSFSNYLTKVVREKMTKEERQEKGIGNG